MFRIRPLSYRLEGLIGDVKPWRRWIGGGVGAESIGWCYFVPVVYRCSRCGFPLYVFARVGQSTSGIQPPSTVIYMYGGVCPRCGKVLRPPSLRDIVIDTNVKARLAELAEYARRIRLPLTSLEQHLSAVHQPSIHGPSVARGEVEAEA